MNLVRLIYFSRDRFDRQADTARDAFAAIVAASATNNRRDNITGGLIHDAGWFGQVLEGPESVVTATFERILADERHSAVSLVSMQPISERDFGQWWMVGVVRDKDNDDIFRHYGESDRFDPRLMRADRLYDLIGAVAERMAELPGRTSWTTRSATNAA